MTPRWIAGLAALTALGAYQASAQGDPPMVGGPCRYEFTTITATVTRIFDDGIELSEPDGQTFEIRPQDFPEPPESGQRYKVAKRYVVEGSCTPYGYMLAGPAED